MFRCSAVHVLHSGCSRHGFLHQRMNTNGTGTKYDLFSWNNKYSKYMNIYTAQAFTFIFLLSTTNHSVHAGISKPWRGRLPRPVVVFSSHHVSCLISFLVRAQLTLFVPASGTGSPFPQNGVPIHRIRAHSLSRVRDSGTHYTLLFHPDTQISTQKYCTLQTRCSIKGIFPHDCSIVRRVVPNCGVFYIL
jgi:hypothetical protein